VRKGWKKGTGRMVVVAMTVYLILEEVVGGIGGHYLA
jgi:hypothetical protein